jgi:tRNA (adenine37-N6)-methyltransferase
LLQVNAKPAMATAFYLENQETIMASTTELRLGELAMELPPPTDAALVFVGRIHTPWTSRGDTPRQGRMDGPECRIEIFAPFVPALAGLERFEQIEVLYWLDRSRRDLLLQSPSNDGRARGTFALRSPVRPNPIGLSRAKLLRIEGANLFVRGLDCLDGTPLIDIKPDRCGHSHPQPAAQEKV